MKIFQTLLLLCCIGTQAQQLTGTINDPDGFSIQDVVITNRSQDRHAHTDDLGVFELLSSPNDTIVFSHLGYETLELIAGQYLEAKNNIFIMQPTTVSLSQVVINSEVSSLNQMVDVDLKVSPVRSSQELLQRVPGLFIGQHAGGGKAEQIFLRGFDIDHGTDVTLSVDGLPVNMVSHAHGQGYSDLHFVIPETLDDIDFGKGPYEAQNGDFNTAGYVSFKTKDRIKDNLVQVSYGDFANFRALGMFKLLDDNQTQAYVASELQTFDGPFESPQNFTRVNLFGKFTTQLDDSQRFEASASYFRSKWNASGQIPWRAVRSGLIDRFGAIDDTEGGQTSRSNLVLNYQKRLKSDARIASTVYYSRYDFELFSNFTFFLENPEDGDQIRQTEERQLMGFQTQLDHLAKIGNLNFDYTVGAGLRYDKVDDIALSRTKNRSEILERLAFGNINQINGYAFASANLKLGNWRLNPGIRLDGFQFDYEDFLADTFSNPTASAFRLSPKFNLFYKPSSKLEFFLKNGIGFHSNDTRVVVNQPQQETLPAAFGTDLGLNWKPTANLNINAALWSLFLEQEFVYVGDEAVVEPSGKTRRLGIDLGLQYEPFKGVYFQQNINYAYARSTEEPSGADYIPLAPNLTATGSLSFKSESGFNGGRSSINR